MENDDLYEPVEADNVCYVSTGRFSGSPERYTQNYSHFIRQRSAANKLIRSASQPEVRVRHPAFGSDWNRTRVHLNFETRNITGALVQQRLSENISFLRGFPAPMNLEDDLDDPLEPFIGQRFGLRMRDDLDEPLAQPPLQRTRFELVDDLHEPEDLSQTPELELNDDLLEPVENPPPGETTHDLHDDLDDPVVYPRSDPPINDHGLFDDLEEPVTTNQLPHRKEVRLHGEPRNDLDDPDDPEDTRQEPPPPRGASGALDHLYDDLDELMVDELISEVSDLVLQGHHSALEYERRDRDNFGGKLKAPSANPVPHHTLVGYACIKYPLPAAHVTPVSQQENKHSRRIEFERRQYEPPGQVASEQTVVSGSPSTGCSGQVRASGARDSGSNFPSKSSQMTQYDGTRQTSMGSAASQQRASAISAAGDVPARPASSWSVAAETQNTSDTSQPAKSPSQRSTSQVRFDTADSQGTQVPQVQSQCGKFTSKPITTHSNIPAKSELSTPTSSCFSAENVLSQPSPPQSPLLLPVSSSQRPPSPPWPVPSEALVPPLSPLPFLSGTHSHHARSATAVSEYTNEPAPPTTPVTRAPPPPATIAPPPPVPPVTSTWPARGAAERGPVRRLAAGDRGPRCAVQTETVLARIDALLAAVAACRQRGETPELMLPAKTRWRDLQLCSAAGHLVVSEETPRAEVRMRSASRLNMMVLLLQKIRHLVATNTHSTKRDIYYQEVSLFGSQRAVDALLDDVTGLLAIPRESSHVRATSKGLVAGQLVLRCGDVLLDCSAAVHGVLVPENVPHVQLVSSSARFILVVEKDATFQKILDSGVLRHLPPAVLITGKGFPDLNTRMLLRMLTSRLEVPALALLDADPHGLEIFFVYKYGSLARARESDRLTTPGLMWLGVRPTEVLQLELPPSALLPLTAADRSKAHCLLSRPYVKHNRLWQRQIREILASGRKAEIQCLSAIHPTFLTDVYLPSKIQECLAGDSAAAAEPEASLQTLTATRGPVQTPPVRSAQGPGHL